ncbi:hypothetical protein niasHT_014613 [Heterodera trifolii]|uniref:Uncharacterized protein n=1 Tax=Heterodera trifolii TaxID=157864 RepID=A0ABD2LI13_9BILA
MMCLTERVLNKKNISCQCQFGKKGKELDNKQQKTMCLLIQCCVTTCPNLQKKHALMFFKIDENTFIRLFNSY